jgi:hypothetical protein
MLNRRNRPIVKHLVTVGTLTSTLAHLREVFRALASNSLRWTQGFPEPSCCLKRGPTRFSANQPQASDHVGLETPDQVGDETLDGQRRVPD